jgi:hypothetical protein
MVVAMVVAVLMSVVMVMPVPHAAPPPEFHCFDGASAPRVEDRGGT